MSRDHGRDQAPEPEEEHFDAFAPNPRNSPSPDGGSVTSTGSWEAFPTTFPIPVVTPDDPPSAPLPRRTPGKAPHPGRSATNPAGAVPGAGPEAADATSGASMFVPGSAPHPARTAPGSTSGTSMFVPGSALGPEGGAPGTGPGSAPVVSAAGGQEAAEAAPGSRESTRRSSAPPQRRERPRRGGLVRALRGAGLLVAAAGVVAATIGVQWWDKSAWVADRYPATVVTDVTSGQEATMRGVRWKAAVTGGPAVPGQDPGTASLVVDVQVTPTSTAEIQRSFPPRFTMRDRAGHVWLADAEETPIRSDLKVGQPVRMKVVAVVPERLRDTAEFVLSYSERETLRFAR
ncbi:hypothetical protein [Sphaerisporangium dianthi]|uniref:DUF4352 domain-containing protein n=1 Tax=Sphaerisporangium dianthi TaxID=1436120 RepID=A0ABV9CB25_9ACTN